MTDDQAYELLAHLIASAETCTREPHYYGSFRLLDAASRLMGFMIGDADPTDEQWLRDYKSLDDVGPAAVLPFPGGDGGAACLGPTRARPHSELTVDPVAERYCQGGHDRG